MQRTTLGVWRYQRAAGLYVTDPARLTTRSAAVGAALIVGSALAFALDGPVAQAAYRQGLDPAAFGFWRALAGALVLGGFLATRPRSGVLAGIRRMRRAAGIRLALAALAGLGLNLALFQAFARLPVAVAVTAFGCYPLLVAAWEAAPPHSGTDRRLVRLDHRSSNGRGEGGAMPQDRQWFINTLRRLGYTEAAEEAERELPDPVSTDELIKFADRFNISRDEVMSQMGGSP